MILTNDAADGDASRRDASPEDNRRLRDRDPVSPTGAAVVEQLRQSAVDSAGRQRQSVARVLETLIVPPAAAVTDRVSEPTRQLADPSAVQNKQAEGPPDVHDELFEAYSDYEIALARVELLLAGRASQVPPVGREV